MLGKHDKILCLKQQPVNRQNWLQTELKRYSINHI
ncbi:hypothetical protein [Thalassotalea aquiviva]